MDVFTTVSGMIRKKDTALEHINGTMEVFMLVILKIMWPKDMEN